VLRELIDELRRDRDHWREMAQSRLALPAPRRSLWPFGRPAVFFLDRLGSFWGTGGPLRSID
jgi:hypothetical protein